MIDGAQGIKPVTGSDVRVGKAVVIYIAPGNAVGVANGLHIRRLADVCKREKVQIFK